MNEKEVREFHKLIEDYSKEKNITTPKLLAFFSALMSGTMAMHGYSEAFADETFDRMKINFRKQLKMFKEENDI